LRDGREPKLAGQRGIMEKGIEVWNIYCDNILDRLAWNRCKKRCKKRWNIL